MNHIPLDKISGGFPFIRPVSLIAFYCNVFTAGCKHSVVVKCSYFKRWILTESAGSITYDSKSLRQNFKQNFFQCNIAFTFQLINFRKYLFLFS